MEDMDWFDDWLDKEEDGYYNQSFLHAGAGTHLIDKQRNRYYVVTTDGRAVDMMSGEYRRIDSELEIL